MHRRAPGRPEGARGQVLVIFALSLVAIMAAAGLAFDVGRFYSERRYLQNAADAGALAIANALIRGETATDAEAEGRDVLTRNLAGSPTGTAGQRRDHARIRARPRRRPGLPDQRRPDHVGRRRSGRRQERRDLYLRPGHRAGIGDHRRAGTRRDQGRPAADRGPPLHQRAGSVRRCDRAVRRQREPLPGPHRRPRTRRASAARPTAHSAPPRTRAPRSTPTTPDDDPVNHGPIIALVGQGASPSNAASFRGFVALDIRNFQYQSPPSNVFYNGVTAGTGRERPQGHRGGLGRRRLSRARTSRRPSSRPIPNDQVAIIDGNSTGIVIDEIDLRYDPGAEVLAAVYSGTVQSIPDFAYQVASTATINTNQNRNNTITMNVTKNASFTGVVQTFVVAGLERSRAARTERPSCR